MEGLIHFYYVNYIIVERIIVHDKEHEHKKCLHGYAESRVKFT